MKKILLTVMTLFLFSPLKVSAYSASATSAILMDMDSNKIIYADNIYKQRSIASISKIMTAILAVESGKLEEIVTVGEEISGAYGSGVYIKIGEEIKLKDLVYGLMLRSGNDAALSIAKYVSGSVEEFIKLMNEKAVSVGMKNSIFNNPSGLDDKGGGNISTAYDMAMLTSYAMKNEIYKEIVSTKNHKVKTNMNYYDWTNKNRLLNSYKYCTGGKTGFTEIARRTLVTTASKDGINLVVVTLNDGNDFVDHQNLFEEAFSEFTKYKILEKGYVEIIDEEFYSNRKFYIKEEYSEIFNANEIKNVILKFELSKKFDYKTGDKIGVVKVLSSGKEIFKTDVFIELKKKKVKVFEFIFGWLK